MRKIFAVIAGYSIVHLVGFGLTISPPSVITAVLFLGCVFIAGRLVKN